ncbi:MAG: YCF48-related protein [Ignavibacteriaceae bacterium]
MKNRISFSLFIIFFLLAVAKNVSPQESWTWQNPLPQGNDITDIYAFNSDTAIFVGWKGVIGKTTDRGLTWDIQTVTPILNLYSVDFADANTGWAVSDNGYVYKTTDAGLTWTGNASNIATGLKSVDFIDLNTGWIAGISGKISKSTNGGTTWTTQTTGTTALIYQIAFVDLNIGWAVGSAGLILKTTNGGSAWVQQTSSVSATLNSIFPLSSTVCWAVGGSNGTILKTIDGGLTWTSQTSGTSVILYSVSFADANFGWAVGTTGTVLRTTNGGTNWSAQPLGSANTIYSVSLIDANKAWIAGERGDLFYTSNGGADWMEKQYGVTLYLYDIYFTDQNTGWAVGSWGTLLKTTNGGSTWSSQTSGTISNLYSVKFVSAQEGYAVGDNGTILKTSNSGSVWYSQSSGTNNLLFGIDAYYDGALAVGEGGKILKTTNHGNSWVSQTSGTTANLNAVDFLTSNIAWAVGASGTILKTTNSGSTWVAQTSSNPNALRSVFFHDANRGWAVGDYGIFLKTTNGGLNWVNQQNYSIGWGTVYFIDDNVGWLVGSEGYVFKTTNGGNNWAREGWDTFRNLDGISFANRIDGWICGDNGTIMKYNSPKAVDLLAPGGSEIWLCGSTENITWVSSLVNSLKIEYTLNNGSTWNLLASSYPAASGSYPWVIPQSISSQCKVRITATDNPLITDVSNSNFTIMHSYADSIFISVETAEAVRGDTVTLIVSYQTPVGTSFSAGELNFSGFFNKLQFLSVDTTGTMLGTNKWMFFSNNPDSVLFTAFAGSNDIQGTGILFKLKFKVPADATAGLKPVNVASALFNTGATVIVPTNGGVTVLIPFFGDADNNGMVQAFDASNILKFLTGQITFNLQQTINSDVTLDGTISAVDASKILQFIVHIIDSLPSTSVPNANGIIAMQNSSSLPGGIIDVPVYLTNGSEIIGIEGSLSYDQTKLTLLEVIFSDVLAPFVKEYRIAQGGVSFVGSGTQQTAPAGTLAILRFRVKENAPAGPSVISFSGLRLNEGAVQQNVASATLSILTDLESEDLPSEYMLCQNYPNPFNPVTVIEYKLPKDCLVRIDLFSVTGEKLATLVDREHSAGSYSFNLNTNYLRLSSGIYFYRLTAQKLISGNTFSDIRKMTLMK